MLEGDILMHYLEGLREGEDVSDNEIKQMMQYSIEPGVLPTLGSEMGICCWFPNYRGNYLMGLHYFNAEKRGVENPIEQTYLRFKDIAGKLKEGKEQWEKLIEDFRKSKEILECI